MSSGVGASFGHEAWPGHQRAPSRTRSRARLDTDSVKHRYDSLRSFCPRSSPGPESRLGGHRFGLLQSRFAIPSCRPHSTISLCQRIALPTPGEANARRSYWRCCVTLPAPARQMCRCHCGRPNFSVKVSRRGLLTGHVCPSCPRTLLSSGPWALCATTVRRFPADPSDSICKHASLCSEGACVVVKGSVCPTVPR